MKVGTDAVLLGAWSIGCIQKDKREERISCVLDIGTGTGVLSLMMAQAFPQALITALEINREAFSEAKINIDSSPYAGQIEAIHLPVQHFAPGDFFDLILCNPPYFSGSLLPADGLRQMARHSVALSPRELLDAVDRLLSPEGMFCTILPFESAGAFRIKAIARGWALRYQCLVRDQSASPVKRVLLAITKNPGSWHSNELILKKEDGNRSKEFGDLTSAFYL